MFRISPALKGRAKFIPPLRGQLRNPETSVGHPISRETAPEAMDLNSNPSRQIPEAESADFAFNRGSVNALNFIALQPIDMP